MTRACFDLFRGANETPRWKPETVKSHLHILSYVSKDLAAVHCTNPASQEQHLAAGARDREEQARNKKKTRNQLQYLKHAPYTKQLISIYSRWQSWQSFSCRIFDVCWTPLTRDDLSASTFPPLLIGVRSLIRSIKFRKRMFMTRGHDQGPKREAPR